MTQSSTPRLLAVLSVLIMVAPLAPLPTASAAQTCAPGECVVLPLYVQIGSVGSGLRGLSPLSGDGMPTDPNSHASGGFVAGTQALDFDLRLLKENAFNVSLASYMDPDYVQGSIIVSLRTADGAEFELARRDFVPENFTGLPIAPPPINFEGVTRILSNQTDAQLSKVGQILEAPNLARGALDVLYTQICGNGTSTNGATNTFNTPQCRQLTGRLGQPGAFDFCSSNAPYNNNVGATSYSLWNSVNNFTTSGRLEYTYPGFPTGPLGGIPPTQIIDEQLIPPPGQPSTCRNVFHDLNQTADQYGSAPAQPIRDAFEAVRDLFPLPIPTSVNGTEAPAVHHWRNVTLNADVPAFLTQDASSFVIPSGLRLVLNVDLDAVSYTPAGRQIRTSLILEVGREDTPTFLGIRAVTPQAFSRLAYNAEPIAPGLHTGFFSDPYDIDDYSFEVSSGQRIDVTTLQGSLSYLLHRPDGAALGGFGSVNVTSAEGGRWTLRVSGDVSPEEYGFRLDVGSQTPENDGGWIGEGYYAGHLGPGDNADTWVFHAWLAQRMTVYLYDAHEDGFTLVDDVGATGNALWSVQRSSSTTFQSISGRADATGTYAFTVERDYGDGDYTIYVDLDDAGNLMAVPKVYELWNSSLAFDRPFLPRLNAYEHGVEFGNETEVRRVDVWGNSYRLATEGSGSTARRADGTLLRDSKASGKQALAIDEPGGPNPIARTGAFEFGPQALFVGGAGKLQRVHADRSNESIAVPSGSYLTPIAAPDGSVIVTNDSGAAYRILEHNLSLAREPGLDRVSAFDVYGRAYRVLNRTLVERIEANGEGAIIARADQTIEDIAFYSGYLFVATRGAGTDPQEWKPGGVHVVWTGIPGFSGFRPAFDAPRPPDLVAAGFEDVVTGFSIQTYGFTPILAEDHVLRVHVRNDGASAAAPFNVFLSIDCGLMCGPSPGSGVVRVNGLAAGAETTVEFPWHSAAKVGDQIFYVSVDSAPFPLDVVESNETNNEAEYSSFALVGGQLRTCQALVQDVPWLLPSIGLGDETSDVCRFVRV